MDSSKCSGTSVAQNSMPLLDDVQIPVIKQQEEDDSEPIYLDFNFIAAQQNVHLNVQQPFPYQNNNTFTSELLFNSIYGNINSQANVKPMVKPKRRGRPPNRKQIVPPAPPQPIHRVAEYKMPVLSDNTPIYALPPPEPIIFETIIVCPPKQTKLSVRQKMAQAPQTPAEVETPIVLPNTTKLRRKQQFKLRSDDEYKFVEILDNFNPMASSPERTNEVVFDQELTETPVRPSKRLYQQRRHLSMINKSTVINTESDHSLAVNDLNCEKRAKSSCDSLKYFQSARSLIIPLRRCENEPEESVMSLKKEIQMTKEQKTCGRMNINKKRKHVRDDNTAALKKPSHNKGQDKEKSETTNVGKGRKTSRNKTINP